MFIFPFKLCIWFVFLNLEEYLKSFITVFSTGVFFLCTFALASWKYFRKIKKGSASQSYLKEQRVWLGKGKVGNPVTCWLARIQLKDSAQLINNNFMFVYIPLSLSCILNKLDAFLEPGQRYLHAKLTLASLMHKLTDKHKQEVIFYWHNNVCKVVSISSVTSMSLSSPRQWMSLLSFNFEREMREESWNVCMLTEVALLPLHPVWRALETQDHWPVKTILWSNVWLPKHQSSFWGINYKCKD